MPGPRPTSYPASPLRVGGPRNRFTHLVAPFLLAALVLAGCSGCGSSSSDAAPPTPSSAGPTGAAGTTAPTTPAGIGETWAPERDGRSPLAGFGEVAVTITAEDGTTCQVCLLAATTDAQRERGLMEVTDRDLGGYDGMLFEYDTPVDGAFWMRNTRLPLSIAYFDADGVLVSSIDMTPCSDAPDCPQYPADGAFAYALEVPQGRLDEVGVVGTARLEVGAVTCPLATDAG